MSASTRPRTRSVKKNANDIEGIDEKLKDLQISQDNEKVGAAKKAPSKAKTVQPNKKVQEAKATADPPKRGHKINSSRTATRQPSLKEAFNDSLSALKELKNSTTLNNNDSKSNSSLATSIRSHRTKAFQALSGLRQSFPADWGIVLNVERAALALAAIFIELGDVCRINNYFRIKAA